MARTSALLDKESTTGDRILPHVTYTPWIMSERFVVHVDQPFSLRLVEFPMEFGEY